MAHTHDKISVLPNEGPIAGTIDEARRTSLDPLLFKPEAASAETLAANEKFLKATAGATRDRARAATGRLSVHVA